MATTQSEARLCERPTLAGLAAVGSADSPRIALRGGVAPPAPVGAEDSSEPGVVGKPRDLRGRGGVCAMPTDDGATNADGSEPWWLLGPAMYACTTPNTASCTSDVMSSSCAVNVATVLAGLVLEPAAPSWSLSPSAPLASSSTRLPCTVAVAGSVVPADVASVSVVAVGWHAVLRQEAWTAVHLPMAVCTTRHTAAHAAMIASR